MAAVKPAEGDQAPKPGAKALKGGLSPKASKGKAGSSPRAARSRPGTARGATGGFQEPLWAIENCAPAEAGPRFH